MPSQQQSFCPRIHPIYITNSQAFKPARSYNCKPGETPTILKDLAMVIEQIKIDKTHIFIFNPYWYCKLQLNL
jgi:hypothetical protein